MITAGPTREYFDSVRFISNPSTGRMGYAIASAAADAGHEVTLVSGPVEVATPRGVRIVPVETAAQMLAASRNAFRTADAAVFAAAVSDYRPRRRAPRKLPKRMMLRRMELVPTADIAATLGKSKGRRVTIAFALEDHDARRHAQEKLLAKHCDAIVLNGPATVGSNEATVELLVRGGSWQSWGTASKAVVARRIVQALERLAAR